MTDDTEDDDSTTGDASEERGSPHPATDAVDDVPRISCARCGRAWSLDYELEDLRVGNQAIEQFALDHQRHTGHFPDGVSTWRAHCRRCPERVERLGEDAARRWAELHGRHTRHTVEVRHESLPEPEIVEPDST